MVSTFHPTTSVSIGSCSPMFDDDLPEIAALAIQHALVLIQLDSEVDPPS